MTELRVAALFAGIGGMERGLDQAGLSTTFLCEVDRGCQLVLRKRFPQVPIEGDIRVLKQLPPSDVVSAGFPCQDLSQAGQTAGIDGRQSGLIGELFRLVDSARPSPTWLVIENVPFMLRLDKGRAMRFLTESLEELGYQWAYRIVDTRAFGLPQRRQRVVLVASKKEDPRSVLFCDDAGESPPMNSEAVACGFYWTEGVRGLGWAVDAVPTLKGGSTVGIPSPPAILMPHDEIVTPDQRDAERLQGFPADWTKVRDGDKALKRGARWKMVGNAVSVPVFKWLGRRLLDPGSYESSWIDELVPIQGTWPKAGWGRDGKVFPASVSPWPVRATYRHLEEFLRFPLTPLSARATGGFLARTRRSRLRFPEGFIDKVAEHLRHMEDQGPER